MLQKVQHRFTRMVRGVNEFPYKDRLKQLGLWTLEERRNRADLLEMSKMLIGKSSPKFESLFERSTLSATRGHSVKLVKHRCKLDVETCLRGYSRSLKLVPFESLVAVSYSLSIVRMAISVTVCEIFSVKEWRDLENQVKGRSRSFKMAPFDRPYATFYWSAIVNIALSCAVFELFDVEY